MGVVDELALVGVAAAAIALISCLSVGQRRRIRWLPRGAWVAVILLVPLAGPAAWFGLGRPRRLSTRRPIQERLRRRSVRSAPDDDPEFLRSLRPPEPSQEPDDQRGPEDRPGPEPGDSPR